MAIQHAYTLNPVTALAYCCPTSAVEQNKLLLVGEGAFLKVYDTKSSKLIAQCRAFDSQTVHGVTVQENLGSGHGLVAIWGGRSIVLLNDIDLESIISGGVNSLVSREIIAPDWLLDCAISPFDGLGGCIFITAHSAALQVLPTEGSKRPFLRQLSSPSRSILYSANIVWTSQSSFMVAAGTVFGAIEIVTWDIVVTDVMKSSRILFTFTGHEGSIFGVQISPEIRDSNGQLTRILASCSDDRTIRIWDLSSLNSPQVGSSLTIRPLRDTGFGEVPLDLKDMLSVERCISTAMGHASRIWQVKFITPKTLDPDKATPVNILSFGEDSTVQQWALNGWSKEANDIGNLVKGQTILKAEASLTHIRTFSHHAGKHIWSSSLLATNQLRSMLATGGADGAVSLFDIFLGAQQVDQESARMSQIVPLDELSEQHEHARSWIKELYDLVGQPDSNRVIEQSTLKQIPSLTELRNRNVEDISICKKIQPQIPKDSFNKYALIGPSQLLLTTTSGRIISQSSSLPHTWLGLSLPEGSELDLKSYSVVTGIPDYGVAILAGANGKVYMHYPSRRIEQIADLQRKVAGLFYIPRPSHDAILVLATLLGCSEATLIAVRSLSSREVDVEVIHLPPGFVVTSAGEVNNLIILGSRNGQLAVYDLQVGKTPRLTVQDERFRCHDAITSVVKVPVAFDALDHFVITVRDGTYAIFKVSVNLNSDELPAIGLQLVHQVSLPFGPMIEGASFCGKSLIIYGFRSKSFVAWNETQQLEISRVECGGAHRSYAFSVLPQYCGIYFAFTKASRLHIHEHYHPSHIVLKSGGHGREIKCCAVSEDQRFIATAAEDTDIKIWKYSDHENNSLGEKLQCYVTLRKHSAGVQHLQWATVSESFSYLFSGGGYEEFNVWAISSVPGFGLGAVCEATLSDLSEDRDLRIMNFDIVAVSGGLDHGDTTSEATFLIAMAFSDSTIRAYWYTRSQGFEKLARGRYTSACLTQINVLPSSYGQTTILTGSTDGHLALWKFSEDDDEADNEADVTEFIMTKTVQAHQSTILSLDILPIGPDGFLVASGGDDNAVSLTYLSADEFTLRLTVPSAHAAAVSGLCFAAHSHNPGDTNGSFRFCTVGGDQKVKNWKFVATAEREHEAFKLKELRLEDEMEKSGEVTATVPDAAGIAAFGGNCGHQHCLVYGNGIEVFEI